MGSWWVDNRLTIHVYLSGIGSIVALIIITAILCQMVFYFKNLKKKDTPNQNKCIYITFFVICLMSSIFVCIPFAFTKHNLFTNQSSESLTGHYQCQLSYFIPLISLIIVQMSIYGLLVYRLQITFSNSLYRYSDKVYISLYSSILIIIVTVISIILSSIPWTEFGNYSFQQNAYCSTVNISDTKFILDLIATFIFLISQIIYYIILLFMFAKRLYSLKKELISQHLAEISKTRSPSVSVVTVTVTPTQTQMTPVNSHISSNNGTDWTPTKTQSDGTNELPDTNPSVDKHTKSKLSISEFEKNKDQNSKTIVNLHRLIKRHTILVFIMVITTIIWLVLLTTESSWWYIQIIYVLLVNIVCIWLMYSAASPVWNCCTKYFCCWICYCSKCQSGVNQKPCLFFC